VYPDISKKTRTQSSCSRTEEERRESPSEANRRSIEDWKLETSEGTASIEDEDEDAEVEVEEVDRAAVVAPFVDNCWTRSLSLMISCSSASLDNEDDDNGNDDGTDEDNDLVVTVDLLRGGWVIVDGCIVGERAGRGEQGVEARRRRGR
jgi:hypothetical protein